MPGKRLLLDVILHEIDIVKFLGTKVASDALEYRPAPAQPSMLELLQYLTYCGHRVAKVVLTQNTKLRDEYAAEGRSVTLASFGQALERQAKRLRELSTSECWFGRDPAE